MVEKWIVVQTQSRRELWAAENIARIGYECYFPKMHTMAKVRGNLSVARVEPLFPRHLFVRSDEGQWRSLTGCWGVSGVVMCGQSPGFLPVKDVLRLRAMEDADGLVVLPDRSKPAHGHAHGDQVRVTEGAFAGFTGIYQSDAPKDRLKVLLDVLGRKTTVLISDRHVEPV